MATFQSQINILAAVNCGVHKRIDELENNQIMVKYNEESTEFCIGNETKQIKYLGYKAYDAILLFKEENYYLMGYNGKCEKIEDNKENILYTYIYFKELNSDNDKYDGNKIIFIALNGDERNATILNLNCEVSALNKDIIIHYQLDNEFNKYGFIKLTNNIDINKNIIDENGDVFYLCLTEGYIRYESNINYENIKFIDLSERL